MLKLDRAFIEATNEQYQEQVLTLTKEEKKVLARKDTFRKSMIGFLTPDYYKREKLILNGKVVYGYIFKTRRTGDEDEPIQVWILTSPEDYFLDHPEDFQKIAQNLGNINFQEKEKDKSIKIFKNILQEKNIELKYREVPAIYAEEHVVFISVVLFHKDESFDFKHGINLFIGAQEISKELLFLPLKLWPEEYRKSYFPVND